MGRYILGVYYSVFGTANGSSGSRPVGFGKGAQRFFLYMPDSFVHHMSFIYGVPLRVAQPSPMLWARQRLFNISKCICNLILQFQHLHGGLRRTRLTSLPPIMSRQM